MKKTIFILIIYSSFSIAQNMNMDLLENNHEDRQQSSEHKFYHEKDFSITPSVQWINFPHPMNGGLEFVFSNAFGIKYQQSFRPRITIDNSEAELDNQSLSIRTYPGLGSWFFGLGYGKHSVNAKVSGLVNGVDTNIYANLKSDYLTPTMGWKWVYDSGFTIGIEFGWIFAINRHIDIYSDQESNPVVNISYDYQQKRKDSENSASKYLSNGLLSLGLLEVGWTF